MRERREGFVIVALMALSTVIMLTIVGTVCVVGSMHYRFCGQQEIRAEKPNVEIEESEPKHEAMALQALV